MMKAWSRGCASTASKSAKTWRSSRIRSASRSSGGGGRMAAPMLNGVKPIRAANDSRDFTTSSRRAHDAGERIGVALKVAEVSEADRLADEGPCETAKRMRLGVRWMLGDGW